MSRYNAQTASLVKKLMEQEQSPEDIIAMLREKYTNDNTFVQMVSAIRFHCLDRIPTPSREQVLQCLSTGPEITDEEKEKVLALTTFREMYKCYLLRRCKQFMPLIAPDWLQRFQVPSKKAKQKQQEAAALNDTMIHIPDLDIFVQWLVHTLETEEEPEAEEEEGGTQKKKKKDDTLFIQTVICLAVCTGRRMVELLGTGRFEHVEGHAFMLRFSGQVKQRRTPGASSSFCIPIFFPASMLLPKIEMVQAHVRKYANLGEEGCMAGAKYDKARFDIHQKYVGKLNRSLHCEFDNALIEGTDYTFHDLRAIYAYLSYEFCCPKKNATSTCPAMPFPKWMKQVLGHVELSTSLHYNRVHVTTISSAVRAYFHNMVVPSSPSLFFSSSPPSDSNATRARLAS